MLSNNLVVSVQNVHRNEYITVESVQGFIEAVDWWSLSSHDLL